MVSLILVQSSKQPCTSRSEVAKTNLSNGALSGTNRIRNREVTTAHVNRISNCTSFLFSVDQRHLFLLICGGAWFVISVETLNSLSKTFRSFSLSFQAVPEIKPNPLPSTFFPIPPSLIVLPFDVVCLKKLRALLNVKQISI